MCKKCNGSGKFNYPTIGTWRVEALRKIGEYFMTGHAFKIDVCNKCWGSGDSRKPGKNLEQEFISKYLK